MTHVCGCTPKRPCETARELLIEGNEEGLIEHLEAWASQIEERDVYPSHAFADGMH